MSLFRTIVALALTLAHAAEKECTNPAMVVTQGCSDTMFAGSFFGPDPAYTCEFFAKRQAQLGSKTEASEVGCDGTGAFSPDPKHPASKAWASVMKSSCYKTCPGTCGNLCKDKPDALKDVQWLFANLGGVQGYPGSCTDEAAWINRTAHKYCESSFRLTCPSMAKPKLSAACVVTKGNQRHDGSTIDGCPSWCNHYVCDSPLCSKCDYCAKAPDRCNAYCNKWLCNAGSWMKAHCGGCDFCGGFYDPAAQHPHRSLSMVEEEKPPMSDGEFARISAKFDALLKGDARFARLTQVTKRE